MGILREWRRVSLSYLAIFIFQNKILYPVIAATPFLACHYNQEVGCCTRICLLFCNSAYVKKDENKIKTQLLIVCSHSLATDFFSSSPWTQTSSRETGGNFLWLVCIVDNYNDKNFQRETTEKTAWGLMKGGGVAEKRGWYWRLLVTSAIVGLLLGPHLPERPIAHLVEKKKSMDWDWYLWLCLPKNDR